MRLGSTRSGVAVAVAVTAMLAAAGTAGAATIKVDTTADEHGVGAGCSLREAITAANGDAPFGGCTAGSGADEVRLAKGAVYGRSLDGNLEDANATGDLDVNSPIALGPRKGKATIDAESFDRGIDVLGGGELALSRVIVTGASETYPAALVAGTGVQVGDGARLTTSRVSVTGNETLGNSANNGGGLLVQGGAVKLDRTKIKGNRAGNVGGGVAVYSGNLKIRRSSISGNQSGYAGGGLYLGGSLTDPDLVQVRDSTVAGNVAGNDGGGIYASIYGTGDGGTDEANLTNVTISGNGASGSGGGIFQYVGQVNLRSATVTRNTADADASGTGHGGGLSGGVSFLNSIVDANFDLNPVAPTPDCDGAPSAGRNVIGAGCVPGPGDATGSPRLGPLKRNGGPTSTHALRRNSSAIGLAKRSLSPKRDQRAVKRDKDPDSGAYERE